MAIRFALITSLLCCILSAHSQNLPPDSLVAAFRAQTGAEKLETGLYLIKRYDLPENGSIYLADTLFDLGTELGLDEKAIEAILTQGHIWFDYQEFDHAKASYFRAWRTTMAREVRKKVHPSFGAIAGVYHATNQPDSAILWSDSLVAYWKSLPERSKEDSVELIDAYQNLAYYNTINQNLFEGYRAQDSLLHLATVLGDSGTMAAALIQKATIMDRQLDIENAEKEFMRAIDISERSGDIETMIVGYNNLGLMWKKEKQYDKAGELYQKALGLVPQLTEQWSKDYLYANLYNNVGTLARMQGNNEAAVEAARKSIFWAKKDNQFSVLGASAADLSHAFSNLGMPDSARHYLRMAEGYLSRTYHPKQYKDLLEARVAFLELTKDFDDALEAQKAFTVLGDSLNRIEQDIRLTFQQHAFKQAEQQRIISDLQEKNIAARRSTRLLIALLAALLILTIVIVLGISLNNRKNKQLLEQSLQFDKLKSRFFANISHEFRTPLTLILGPVETLLAKASDSEKSLLQLIRRHALQMQKLINQVMELSRAEAGKLTLRASQRDAVPFLRHQVYAFSSQAERQGIELSFETEADQHPFFFQRDHLELIVNNLLNNALKFTPGGGEIRVAVSQVSQPSPGVVITVSDTGAGIAPEHLPHIFERFYQADNSSIKALRGTGIGLSLTKELVELHGGTISVASQPGHGTTFRIWFPSGNAHLRPDQISPISSSEEGLEENGQIILAEQAEPEVADTPLILLVEDQPEMLEYLRSELGHHYRVMAAANGRIGLDLARKEVPDLILTDMMMPEMDGIELTTRLKEDPVTDHIPVIMITARGEQEDLMEALQSRVNEYMTKPFHPEELLLRIRNLLELKQKNRRTEPGEIAAAPAAPAYSPEEQRFIDAIDRTIGEHLTSESLDVHLLADAVHLSRSQLFRKLRGITGESPTSYIRRYRLERARTLLMERAGTVTEVSYLVGFSSPTYFSRCFSEQYGVPPVEFARQ